MAGELAWCPVSERCVRTTVIIFLPPCFDQRPCLLHVSEPVRVQALCSEGSIKALDERIRAHCQLHPHRGVQEDVSGLFILFIHGWDESLNWSSIAAHGARIDSFSTTREGA
jgi:hypothetical protein